MVVDDHALVRSAIRQALNVPGVELIAEAASAEEALSLAPAVRPDVLLVDIDLPGMDGVRLVRELASRLPTTRMIMLTVSAADHDVVEAMTNGAAGYLTKDISPAALLQAIRSAHRGELVMGRAMGARLIHHLLDRRRAGAAPPDGFRALTDREREVLRLLSDGLTDREIAAALTLSIRTVEAHVSSLLHKLDARNRAHAARLYSESFGS
jgi:two-component system nitrate/nitrite response regulator NarL